jgi:hypothetical protein
MNSASDKNVLFFLLLRHGASTVLLLYTLKIFWGEGEEGVRGDLMYQGRAGGLRFPCPCPW